MKEEPLVATLKGAVEVDEMCLGGNLRDKGNSKRGRVTNKTAVMVLDERGAEARAKPVSRLSAEKFQGEIREDVNATARAITDRFPSCRDIGSH